MEVHYENSLGFARELDRKDELGAFRQQFLLPPFGQSTAIYFLGNSLGLQPKATKDFVQEILDQWSQKGVEAFFEGEHPWLNYHDQLVRPLAEIVGAKPSEIVVMNQLTVNLHLMMVSFYNPQGQRKKIICEAKAFPSDQYMLETHLRQRGLDPGEVLIEIKPRSGSDILLTEDIINVIEKNRDELALVFMGGVHYYTGQVLDIAAITKAAQAVGAKAGFDLAHAAGNIPLQLHEWNVDFACWCHYKYLNAGPGAVAGAFIHERYHTDKSVPRLAGWWGCKKETRFLMRHGFDPTPSAEGWQLSTPSPILYASLKASFELFDQAGMPALFTKAQQLNGYLFYILEKLTKQHPGYFRILTPKTENGCQLSLLFQVKGKIVFDHLTAHGIYADWREPDVIRVAPVPLYNTFEEVWLFGQALHVALKLIDEI